jgi:hypothetical protein
MLSENAQLAMNGGALGSDLDVGDDAFGSFSSGTIGGNVSLTGNGALYMTNGLIVGNVDVADESVFRMKGGSIGGTVALRGNSNTNWTGGTVAGQVSLYDNATLFWDGGKYTAGSMTTMALFAMVADDDSDPLSIYLYDDSSLVIGGQELSANLLDGNSSGGFSEYELSGALGDGGTLPDGLLLFVENGTGANFSLVPAPEPGCLGLICGMAILCRRPARRRVDDAKACAA